MKLIENTVDVANLLDCDPDVVANGMEYCDSLQLNSQDIISKQKHSIVGTSEDKMIKISNGNHESIETKCNGAVNGHSDSGNEDDFQLIMENSDDEGSPLKKIDDKISAPQIVQEIQQLLGIDANTVLDEELDKDLEILDSADSIDLCERKNLVNGEIVGSDSQESQLDDSIEIICHKDDKDLQNEEDSGKEENNDKADVSETQAAECDSSSNINIISKEAETNLEIEEVSKVNNCEQVCRTEGPTDEESNKTEISSVNEEESRVESTTESRLCLEEKHEVLDKDTAQATKTEGNAENRSDNEVGEENFEENCSESGFKEDMLEWTVVDSIECSEDEDGDVSEEKKLEKAQETSTPEKTESMDVGSQLENKQGELPRKRAVSVDEEGIECKKPKLDNVEDSEVIFQKLKRRSSNTLIEENQMKRTKLETNVKSEEIIPVKPSEDSSNSKVELSKTVSQCKNLLEHNLTESEIVRKNDSSEAKQSVNTVSLNCDISIKNGEEETLKTDVDKANEVQSSEISSVEGSNPSLSQNTLTDNSHLVSEKNPDSSSIFEQTNASSSDLNSCITIDDSEELSVSSQISLKLSQSSTSSELGEVLDGSVDPLNSSMTKIYDKELPVDSEVTKTDPAEALIVSEKIVVNIESIEDESSSNLTQNKIEEALDKSKLAVSDLCESPSKSVEPVSVSTCSSNNINSGLAKEKVEDSVKSSELKSVELSNYDLETGQQTIDDSKPPNSEKDDARIMIKATDLEMDGEKEQSKLLCSTNENKDNTSETGSLTENSADFVEKDTTLAEKKPSENGFKELEDKADLKPKPADVGLNQISSIKKIENKMQQRSEIIPIDVDKILKSKSSKQVEEKILDYTRSKSPVDNVQNQKEDKTNLDRSIDRVVEKARKNIGKVLPILKKFHKSQLKKLTRTELEEAIVMKICEAVTDRSELGQLRLRCQTIEQTADMWRKKAVQFEKQNRELEMVLKRFLSETEQMKKDNQNKVVLPIKVTRSVGLQVVLASSMHGSLVASKKFELEAQSKLRQQNQMLQMQQQQQQREKEQQQREKEQQQQEEKETIKSTSTFIPPVSTYVQRSISKPGPGRPPKQPRPPKPPRPSTPQSTPAPSTKSSSPSTPTPLKKLLPKPKTPSPSNEMEVIDLTDREEKTKATPQSTVGQPKGIRVNPSTQVCIVQSNAVTTPTQTMAYIVQKAVPRPQQYLVTTTTPSPPKQNTVTTRPAAIPLRFAGGQLIPLQTAPSPQVKTTPAIQTATRQVPQAIRLQNQVAVLKHPAPLPAPPPFPQTPGLKNPPTKPQLKIAKTVNGIMLSWSMSLTPDMAKIASYQLYAYQESSQPPTTSLWKKVGDVKALPLPMACTLTQFVDGHKYHFAVRAIDVHKRIGPFSQPSTILLTH